MKVVFITIIPSPYRALQFDKVNETLSDKFIVLYSAKGSKNRKWNIRPMVHSHRFLRKSLTTKGKYLNLDIFKVLNELKPDIIITSGLFPTCILAYLYSRILRKKHIYFTDSWLHHVKSLGHIRKWLRKVVIRKSDACVCVGSKGKQYLLAYGASPDDIFISPLAIDNGHYKSFIKSPHEKNFDIIFSGQFIDIKMPFFFVEVLKKIYEMGVKAKVLLIGAGELKDEFIERLESLNIDFSYPGFIQQEKLPKYYADARLLLFPTKMDAWGLVANEACAAGTPVITCKFAGVAEDLVIHNENGLILDLDVDLWAENIVELLSDTRKLEAFSVNAALSVEKFSVTRAADGIIKACKYVYKE